MHAICTYTHAHACSDEGKWQNQVGLINFTEYFRDKNLNPIEHP